MVTTPPELQALASEPSEGDHFTFWDGMRLGRARGHWELHEARVRFLGPWLVTMQYFGAPEIPAGHAIVQVLGGRPRRHRWRHSPRIGSRIVARGTWSRG